MTNTLLLVLAKILCLKLGLLGLLWVMKLIAAIIRATRVIMMFSRIIRITIIITK